MVIPTKLVVDTCHATFLELEEKALGEAEAEATWKQRLAMVDSNSEEETTEMFVISKYDLLPESLADMVQVSSTSADVDILPTIPS